MASVIFVFSEGDGDLAEALGARIEAGGNTVDWTGSHTMLDEADFLVVLWTVESVKITPIIVSARLALHQNKLIQIVPPGITEDKLPAEFRAYRFARLTESKEPITEDQLRAGLADKPSERLMIDGPMFALSPRTAHPGAAASAMGFVSSDAMKPPPLPTKGAPRVQTRANQNERRPLSLTLDELLALDNHYFAQNALYASGAGTLTQFNAIVVALNAGLLTQAMPAAMKLAVVGALALHILAALVLCFALRPVQSNKSPQALLDDTIIYYRRGWTLTVWGIFASVAALLWFVASQAELMELLRQFAAKAPR